MSYGSTNSGRYQALRRTGQVLTRLTPVVTFGIWSLGLGLFLDQARELASDAQFTWDERRVMAAIAVVTIGSCLLAGWVVGRLLKAGADLIEVFADLGESAQRTGDLIERHVIPLLGRIATNLERNSPSQDAANSARGSRPEPSQAAKRPDPNREIFGK